MPLRVGLIGTSFGGSVQIPGFRLVDGVEILAVTSGHLERAPGVRVEAYGTEAALVLEGYEDLRIARNGEAFAPVPLAPPRFVLAPGRMPNVPAFAELVSGVRDAIRGEPHASFPTIADGWPCSACSTPSTRSATDPLL